MAGMGVGKEWADAKAEAQKVLAKDGKLPKPRTDPEASYGDANKKSAAFKKSIEGVEKTILELEEAYAKIELTWKQYRDIIKGSDFDLNPKDDKDAKRITQVQKILTDAIDDIQSKVDQKITIMDKLDEVVTNLNSLADKAEN